MDRLAAVAALVRVFDLWAAFATGARASAKARTFAAFVEEHLRQTSFAPRGRLA